MKSNRVFLVWAGLCFIVVNSLLFMYAYSPYQFTLGGYELRKVFNSDGEGVESEEEISAETIKYDSSKSVVKDTLVVSQKLNTDTTIVEEVASAPTTIEADSAVNDSTHHRILLLGDSEAGGMKTVLNDYCQSNGHKLVATIEWYSATSVNFAKADTISKIIARYKPTYIFVLFGLNEVLAKDAANRRAMARLFHKRLRKVPYAWIGPTNWGQDFVVTDAFRAAADSAAFFSSKSLVLPKASDGRHPSLSGYRIWMANIANWLQSSARWKMKMMPPKKVGYPRKYRTIVFNAAEFKGY
jgi:lysophospholipase L1-like esterase